MEEKEMKISCDKCQREINHIILQKVQGDFIHYDEEENGDGECTNYYIVKCKECGNISFVKQYWSTYQTKMEWLDEINDYADVDYDVKTIYPQPKIGFGKLYNSDYIPNTIKTIYRQTCDALAEGNNVLVGVGMRGIIESFCNEEDIHVPSDNKYDDVLNERINLLKEHHLVNDKDCQYLHAIKEIGNDATHDTREYTKEVLIPLMNIIENVLFSNYVCQDELSHLLPFPNYNSYLDLIIRKIKNLKMNEELNLGVIWVNENRRYGDKKSVSYINGYKTYRQKSSIDIKDIIEGVKGPFCYSLPLGKEYNLKVRSEGKEGDLIIKKIQI